MMIPQGHRLVKSGTFTQANSRLSLVDGIAFFDCGAGLSAYAGLDSGSHEYLIKVYDDDGYSIQGYVGAVGGGEALGGELSSNGTFEGEYTAGLAPSWSKYPSPTCTEDGTNVYAGVAAQKIEMAVDNEGIYQTMSLISGGLHYAIVHCYPYSGVGIMLFHSSVGSPIASTTGTEAYETLDMYFVCKSDANPKRVYLYGSVPAAGVSVDNFSIKQVTDCAATGFHIISAQGGSTQNWQNVSGPFCYNDSAGYSWKLYKVR